MTKMAFIPLVLLGLTEMWMNAGTLQLAKPVFMGPAFGLLHDFINFNCGLSKNPQNLTVMYEIFNVDNMKTAKSVHSALDGGNASIPAYITIKYDGRLICKASDNNNSDIEPSYSDWLDFRVIEPVEDAFILSSPSPEDLWEGESLTLHCNISKGTYVSYSWLLNDMPVRLNHNRSQNHLTIRRLSTHDNGNYVCIASNQFNVTHDSRHRSNAVYVHVKEEVSQPRISFDVFITAEKNVTAIVTCDLTAGSPPLNFSLLKDGQIVTEKLENTQNASFSIPIFLDQDMDLVQCQVSNKKSLKKSDNLNLTVVSVGGAVTMRVEKAEGSLFQVIGVWLHCSVERGTFPRFSWFLNNSRLEGRGAFYSVFGKHHSGLTLSLGTRSAGIYHCEAGNKFDSATRLHSQKILITKEGLNRIPPVVVALIFTCFSLLIVTVTVCCLYGVLRRRRAGRYKLKQYFPEMSNKGAVEEDKEYENEEDIYENKEDIYENEEDIYDEEDDVGVVGEYREDTDVEQSSPTEDSDEDEEENETKKDFITK